MSKFIEVALGDLASPEKRSIISGPFGSSIGTEFFRTSGVPVIRGNNLTTDSRKFIEHGFVFVTPEKAESLNAYALRNDIVITAAGTIGQIGIIPEDSNFEKYVISNKQLRIRIDSQKANPLYVYYWLASPWIHKTITDRNTGSTVPLINLGTLRNLPVRLPPERDAQDKIAELLATLDAKIELNQRMNEELEGMARLLYDYWFVQFDFPITAAQAAAMGKPHLQGHPYRASGGKMLYNEALKREIPAGWRAGDLDGLCSAIRGVTYSKGDIRTAADMNTVPILRATNVNNGIVDLSDLVYVTDNMPSEDQFLKKFDILIVMSSGSKAHVGKNALYCYGQKVAYGAFCSKISSHRSNKFFVAVHLQSDGFKKHISNVCLGTSINNLTNAHITKHQLVLPPKEHLQEYENIASGFFESIACNHQQNQELTALRDWLLPMLMNGQVSVR